MKNQKGKLKIFIVEEHNEAYFVWKYAIRNKLVKNENNTLLHLDEHSDMTPPTLNSIIEDFDNDWTKVKAFVYSELNIASFIVPAIYEGIFNKVYWVRQKHSKVDRTKQMLYVRSVNNHGKKMLTGKMSLLNSSGIINNLNENGIKQFSYNRYEINGLSRLQNVFLDIDLDYFSCIANPLKEELRIEISKQEYESFNDSLYHRLKYFDFIRIETEIIEGQYYYSINKFSDEYRSPLKVDLNVISDRIEMVKNGLNSRKILPEIITICRSRYSGYTPRDQWEFIEKELISSLSEIYNISDLIHISEIY